MVKNTTKHAIIEATSDQKRGIKMKRNKYYKIVGLDSEMKRVGHFGYNLTLEEAKAKMAKIKPPKNIKGLNIEPTGYYY